MPSFVHQFSSVFSTWRFVLGTAIAGACLAIIFSLAFIPLQYASTARILITQPTATGLDPYTAMKSTERIATNLTELVYTSNFFHNAIIQAKGFDTSVFPLDDYGQRKAWRNALDLSVAAGTGILTVTAYHHDPDQARILVDAVSRELALEAPNFFGYSVRVQVIDAPLNSTWFVRPNIILNGMSGFVFGVCLGLAWALMSMPQRTLRSLFQS